MKRILWCVFTLVVWGGIAYFCYRIFGSELAGYIVGVIGAAGTFAAMFFAAPAQSAPDKAIATRGDYSPGEVGGNYSVGNTAPPSPAATSVAAKPSAESSVSIATEGDFSPGSVGGHYHVDSDATSPSPDHTGTNVPPSAGMNASVGKTQIATAGDYSPGWVGGNYQITQTIVQQYEKARRKTWRELSEAAFPLVRDSQPSHEQLWSVLSETAALTFRDAGFTRFTFLLHREDRQVEGERMPIYTMLTNQPAFCTAAHDSYSELMHQLVAWKEAGASADARAAIEKRWQERLKGLENWSKATKVNTRSTWNAIQCTCDSAQRSCEFLSLDHFSLDPADYHLHVTTTSEMLLYVVSALKANIALMGDIGWYAENYPLMKLNVSLLDQKAVEMGAIRYNVHDPEEWDFVNGAFDAEISRFKSSSAP